MAPLAAAARRAWPRGDDGDGRGGGGGGGGGVFTAGTRRRGRRGRRGAFRDDDDDAEARWRWDADGDDDDDEEEEEEETTRARREFAAGGPATATASTPDGAHVLSALYQPPPSSPSSARRRDHLDARRDAFLSSPVMDALARARDDAEHADAHADAAAADAAFARVLSPDGEHGGVVMETRHRVGRDVAQSASAPCDFSVSSLTISNLGGGVDDVSVAGTYVARSSREDPMSLTLTSVLHVSSMGDREIEAEVKYAWPMEGTAATTTTTTNSNSNSNSNSKPPPPPRWWDQWIPRVSSLSVANVWNLAADDGDAAVAARTTRKTTDCAVVGELGGRARGGVPISFRAKARSIHWSPYDRVGVVNAVS